MSMYETRQLVKEWITAVRQVIPKTGSSSTPARIETELFVRYFEAGHLLENFMISAITSVIGIRMYLMLTGYPKLGHGGIHIAHMLWGGLLMLVSIILLTGFLNKEIRTFSSVIGGLGFGTFIDEIGKFITRDNNYFYEPSIALIYMIFVVLFLIFRWMSDMLTPTKQEYGLNALELIKEIVLYDLDIEEKKKALDYLKKADKNNPLILTLIKTLTSVRTQTTVNFGIVARSKMILHSLYSDIVRTPVFAKTLTWIFVMYSLVSVTYSVFRFEGGYTFSQWGQFVSTILSSIFVILGVTSLVRRERLTAFKHFKRALLVSILLTQFFAFYIEQLSATVGLLVTITMFTATQFLIDQEQFRVGEHTMTQM